MASPMDKQLVAAIDERNPSLFSRLLAFGEALLGEKWRLDEVQLRRTYAAACRAATLGERDFLRALLRGCCWGSASSMDQQLVAAINERNLSLFSRLLACGEALQGEKWRLDDEVQLRRTYAAACHAAAIGEIDFLRALRTGEYWGCGHYLRNYVSFWAAKHGDVRCLRLAHMNRLPWSWAAARVAAENGHVDCLDFAIQHCPRAGDDLLVAAINKGQLACVQLLVARGLPHIKPYLHFVDCFFGAEARIFPCLQHLFEQGCPMHPGNLILAAQDEDLDYARFLHKHGVPLWTRACEEDPYSYPFPGSTRDMYCLDNNILPNPPARHAEGMFDILRWGHAFGAPVTPAIEDLIRAKRAATRAVLLSFHGATRLCRGDGIRAQRGAWASMHAIPPVLLEEILLMAGLELPETVGRSLPAQRLVKVEGRWWAPWDENETVEFNTWHCAP